MPKSRVVREAIRLYGDQAGALSVEERDRMLALFDEVTRDIPDRSRGVLDTSVLVEALGAGGALRDELREAIGRSERIAVPALVLYEWLRGPRIPEEILV